MTIRRVMWVLALVGLAAAAPGWVAAQDGGAIEGVVLDSEGGILPGSSVTIKSDVMPDGPVVVYADGSGMFRMDGLPPGTYVVTGALDGFQPSETSVTLVVDQVVTLEFRLALARLVDSVEVTAESIKSGEVSLLDQRRQSAVVSDAISSEEISKTPDSDAASVVDRLTGISVLDDKYVYVRGLGERYSNTTLNGASLASTETEKKVVPLDLFPAKLLDTIGVVKTYTPDKPGTFGSGVVELNTLSFPMSQQVKVSAGISSDSTATGGTFGRYAGGLSWNGTGGQPLPAAIPAALLAPKTRFNPNGFTPQELEEFGESFGAHWTSDSGQEAPYNGSFSATYGNTFGRLGVVVSAVSAHGYDRRDEVQRYFGIDSGNTLVPNNDYTLRTDTESVRNGAVGAVSLRLADGHRVQISTVFSSDASSSSRVQEGFQAAGSYDVRDYRTRYEKEEMLTSRLSGEHFFGGIGQGSSVEWNLSTSNGTRTSDLRENLYAKMSDGSYRLLTGYAEVGKMEYFDLDDKVVDGGVSWTTFYSADTSHYGSVKAGAARTSRQRDFGTRRFKFVTNNPGQFDLTLLPEELFTPENIRPDGFEIREVTGINDAYTGDHTVSAAFVMADATFGKWRVIGGVRYEDSEQKVTTYNPFDTSAPQVAELSNRDWLPALNVVYMLSSRTNVRLAASRTVNRPEFRELSPYNFVEVTAGRSIAGNPELTQATLDGIDLRWETFPDAGEVIAASAFYKRISDPIERYVQATSELRTSWMNAEVATLSGIELELRRSLAVFSPVLRWWSLSLNYSLVNSEVTIPAAALSVITNTNRSLQGQAEAVGNIALQFYQPSWGTMVRLLYNYSGERLTDVGAYGLPDIYESGRATFDIVFTQQLDSLLRGLEFKLAGTNLLDSEHKYTQGSELQRAYRSGRTLGFSFAYSI